MFVVHYKFGFKYIFILELHFMFSNLVMGSFLEQQGRKLTPTTVCGCRYCALGRDNGEELGVHISDW